MARQSRTPGRKIFRPYIRGAAAHGRCAITTRGRWRINRIRRGEIFFARTSVVRRRVAGARSQRAVDGASIAHGRAKNISPIHPWCAGVWRVRDHNVRAMAHQLRMHGRKIFRPYTCGALLHRVCATSYGVAMFDGWANGYRWCTKGRKIFRPYKCGALLNLACAINCRGDACQWDIDGVGATGDYFARAWAGWI